MIADATAPQQTCWTDVLVAERAATLRAARRWFPMLDDADLEDLYQNACEALLRNPAGAANPAGYLRGVVHKQGLMELRRRRCRPVTELEAVEHALPDRERGPQERAEADELAAVVRDGLGQLPPRDRLVVSLRHRWGLDRRETCAALGISPRQYRRSLERGADTLAGIVAGRGLAGGPASAA